jgi:hypothetical protein
MNKVFCKYSSPALLATKIIQQIIQENTVGSFFKMDMTVSGRFNYRLNVDLVNTDFTAISLNYNGNDVYSIRTDHGFDLPLQVSSNNGGPTFTCMSSLVSIYNIIGYTLKF